jgi:hypothetical protein
MRGDEFEFPSGGGWAMEALVGDFDADEDYGAPPCPLLSWRLIPSANGDLVLGLRFASATDSKGEDATGLQISLPATAALHLAEEMSRQARRALA